MSARLPLLAIALAALGGCSSSSESNRTSRAILDLATASVFGGDEAGEVAPLAEPPRSTFEAFPDPVIRLTRGERGQAYVPAVARNRDTVTYQDAARRAITLRGAAINSTTAFEYDLAAIRVEAGDPVAFQTPLSAWPDRVTRSYQFQNRNASDTSITVFCDFENVAPAPITIVGRSYETVRISESCSNGAVTFRNVHWLIAESGEIWRTRQWIGPRNDLITIEFINR